jgi:N6-adenosine-specific RNA methylase IME4
MTANLPALITRAGTRLLDARSSAELLEAKKLAEAALHYAKVTRAANETHADCLRIITRAEMRMANEIDQGQANGEVATRNYPNDARSPGMATFEDIGVSSQRVSEWRQLRDAGEETVETAIDRALTEGRAPTKAEILSAAKQFRAERAEEKKLRREEREVELAAKQAALPQKRYGVIYADPEWRFEPYSRETGMDRAADNHYPTSSLEEIKARDVSSITADDCVLFLWATVPMLVEALDVMAAWGFTYKSHFAWIKDRIGTGYWSRNKHELLLIGTKGQIPAPALGTQAPSAIDAPVGRHSEKPESFYEIIEHYFPNLPKIELNARRARASWDSWGLEAPEDFMDRRR